MESFQPYLTYLGIGIAAIVGIAVIIWAFLAVSVFILTQGIPKFITNFFALIIEDKIDEAYQLTTEKFRAKTSKQQFIKFIKTNKLKQYKRTVLSIPTDEGDSYELEINLILNSGREIPMKIGLVKQGKDWKIDQLETTKVKNA